MVLKPVPANPRSSLWAWRRGCVTLARNPLELARGPCHQRVDESSDLRGDELALGVDHGHLGFGLEQSRKHLHELPGFDEVTRIHGAYGLAEEYPAQRYFRDARFLLFGGGTSEILKTVIAKETLRKPDRHYR